VVVGEIMARIFCQAKATDLETGAAEIKLRAIRRVGEIRHALPKSKLGPIQNEFQLLVLGLKKEI
jgi:hypothetical protein